MELRGQYPRARYFAYHPNDIDLNNLPTLSDRDLDPDLGSVNPFRSDAKAGAKNYYTAKLVFGPPPAEPEPNTRYVGVRKDGKSLNPYVINMLRLYGSDIGDGANSGGVPLPAVTIYNAKGDVVQHFEECDLYAKGGANIRTALKFPALPIADHRARQEPVWSTSSNFEAPSDTMANADAQYLSTYYSERFGDIFVVRGKYLSAPNTRAGESPGAAGYDVRFYSLCTYNIWAGHAVDCLLENEMAVDPEGYYTLVVAREEHRPSNLKEEHATWIDWGGFLDGQITYRFVYRDNRLVQSIARGVVGQTVPSDVEPYVPVALPCTRALFEQGGWSACAVAAGR